MKKLITISFLITTALCGGCVSTGFSSNSHSLKEGEIFYQIFPRSFYDSNGDNQGDLQGIIEKLDYLQNLGITTLWLNPIYSSEMYHNYFSDNFTEVDKEFGTIADFQNLCRAVHQRGMKILIDMETVYISGNHIWYRDSYKNPRSPFSKFIAYNGPDNTDPESIIWNMTELPSFDGQNIKVMTLNLKNTEILEEQKTIYSFWIDPNHDGDFSDGVDGYRMDHIMNDLDDKKIFTDLLTTFWKPIIKHVRSIKPNCFFLAEQADWGSLGTDIMNDSMMDATFNIPLRFGLVENLESFDKMKFTEQLLAGTNDLPRSKVLLNIIENHDLPRFATVVNGNRKKMTLGATFLMTMPGIPCIYYGEEIGMKGEKLQVANDGADIPMREGFEWFKNNDKKGTALWYKGVGSWIKHAQSKNNDGISVEEEISQKDSHLSFYAKIIAIRKKSKALQNGNFIILDNDNDMVFTYGRKYGAEDKVAVILNFSSKPQTTTILMEPLISSSTKGTPFDLISNQIAQCKIDSKGRQYTVTLEPYESKIISIN